MPPGHIDIFDSRARTHQLEPLPDRSGAFAQAYDLLEGYSAIGSDEISQHLLAVRDRAWGVFPYGCIARWRFLDLSFAALSEYQDVLLRLRAGAVFLDLGCGLGQVLRRLVADGAPSTSLVGVDLKQDFVDLGYDLFRDRGRPDFSGARFVVGDVLDPDDGQLKALDGTVDVVYAASLFHLFGWREQVAIGIRLVTLFREKHKDNVQDRVSINASRGRGPGPPTLLGRDLGNRDPLDPEVHAAKRLGRYHHNPQSLQRLWNEVGERTGTRWMVQADMSDVYPGQQQELDQAQGDTKAVIRYVVTRVK